MHELQTAVQHFKELKVVVIGDLILDVFLYGTATQICREAPVPVVNMHTRRDVPGGAANAMVNLAAMGAKVMALSVLGEDREASIMIDLLKERGVNTESLLCDPNRETLAKKRVVSDEQMLVRYDHGSNEPISPKIEKQLISRLRKLYLEADAILISDYEYGLFTPNVMAAIKTLLEKAPKLLAVDARTPGRFAELQPRLVKPNYKEAVRLLGLAERENGKRAEQIITHGEDILQATGATLAAVTLDCDGAVILQQGKAPYKTETRPVSNSKAVGAGDTYVSAFTLALAVGLATEQAAQLASAAAQVVLGKTGTATCSSEELMEMFTPPSEETEKVVGSGERLAELIEGYRKAGRRIVFTNGCFDILHRGHITYLSQAKALGDVLIVGVNGDESVRKIKGAERPMNTLEDRMHVLAALDSVDHVIGFHDNTSTELLKLTKPDIFVKGGNYTRRSLPEARIVERMGGKVEILPYIVDTSAVSTPKIRYRSS